MIPELSILCVTKGEPFAEPFLADMADLALACEAEFVIVADGPEAFEKLWLSSWFGVARATEVEMIQSRGYIESILDDAIALTHGEWVLRLDDDERVTEEMSAWLQECGYVTGDVWSFRRLNLWADTEHALADGSGLLWPDPQTRLSKRELAGGRSAIHQASPHGLGKIAPTPICIEHHKLLVKTLKERCAISRNYDAIEPGKGSGVFLPFSCPELYFTAAALERATVPVWSLLE